MKARNRALMASGIAATLSVASGLAGCQQGGPPAGRKAVGIEGARATGAEAQDEPPTAPRALEPAAGGGLAAIALAADPLDLSTLDLADPAAAPLGAPKNGKGNGNGNATNPPRPTGKVPGMYVASGNNQSAQVGTLLPSPLSVKLEDRRGRPAVGVAVTFAVSMGGGTLAAAQVLSDASGVASTRLTLGPAPGTNNVTATAPGVALAPVTFTATATAAAAAQLSIAAGDGQTGVAGEALAEPLVVMVRDAQGNPVANQIIAFAVASGGGTLSAASVPTDAQGRAATTLTLGPQAGEQRVSATSGGLAGSPITFAARATAGPAAQLAAASGDGQSAMVGAALPEPLVVVVRDRSGNPVAGFDVAFAVASGGGGLSAATVTTDARGLAATRLTVGPNAGANTVTATTAGLAGSPVTFRASAVAAPAAQLAAASGDNQTGVVGGALGAPLVVVVRDAQGNPVPGFNVGFAVATGGGSLSTAQAATNAMGEAATALTLGRSAGTNTVRVTAAGLAGSPLTFTALGTPGPVAALAKVSGDAQGGPPATALAEPLVVMARDAFGNAVGNVQVSFTVATGGGSLTPTTAATNAQGLAATRLTLGPNPGQNAVRAAAAGVTAVTFTADAAAPTAARVELTSGDAQSGTVGAALANPLVVTVRDAQGNPVPNVTVAFAVAEGDGSVSPASAASNAQGQASTRLTLGRTAGTNRVIATVQGLTPVTFSATGRAGAAATLVVVSGDNQSGTAGAALALPFVAAARDAFGNGVQGVAVTFAVTAGGGSLTPASVTTDAQGLASSRLTLGATPGTNRAMASATGLTAVTFTASGMAGAASQIALTSGNNQSGPAGTALANPLVVTVRDASDAPVAGFMVQFQVTAGGGSLSAATVATDAQGRAATTLTLGATAGTNTVVANATGLAGSPVTFTAAGQAAGAASLARLSGDAQSGRIGTTLPLPLVVVARDANSNPVSGVTVTFAVTTGAGALSTASVATDMQGRAATSLTLGTALGTVAVRASVTGVTAVTFSATATPSTYVDDVKPILDARCIACHGPGGVLAAKPLTTYAEVRDGVSFGNLPFVVPMDLAGSVLVQKTGAGGSMAVHLTVAQAGVLRDWVATGALAGGATNVATELARASGDGQVGTVGQALAQPLVAVARNQAGAGVAGVVVTFAVTGGGGGLSATSVTTDAQGRASTVLTLGAAEGTNTVRASAAGLTPVTFSATGQSAFNGGGLAGSTNPLDVAALEAMRADGVQPAGLTTDGEFLRRVTTVLVGRLPTEAELQAFLGDAAPDKRARAIDSLLASPEFAEQWARNVIAVWLEVPSTLTATVNNVETTFRFDSTVVTAIQNDVSMDTLVRDLVTGAGDAGQVFTRHHAGAGGNDMADRLMTAFTGMSSQCARCHDHMLTTPLDDPRWVQDDTYGVYAFFATSNAAATKLNKDGARFGSPVQPRFVADGYQSVPAANVTLSDTLATRRARFATLLTASTAYSRGTAHRIWAEVASPLLDPDEFLQANLAALKSPRLLRALSDVYRQQQGSLKGFLRVALSSRLFQLSSQAATTAADPYQGRYALRRHHSEVLERGVHQVAGVNFAANQVFGFNFGAPTRSSILSRRDEVSLEQGLMQLNSPLSTHGKAIMGSSEVASLAAAVDGGALKQLIPSANLRTASNGAGLDGAYFPAIDFTGTPVRRVDAQVNFDWGTGSPAAGIPADGFSARWTGKVRVTAAGAYTFFTRTDDGVRLWINGALVIDRFVNQGPTEHASPAITLAAGDHDIRMDYFENTGGAVAELRWSSPALGGTVTYDDAARRIVRAALSRDPTAAELAVIRQMRQASPTTRSALEDLAVALGASAEFMFR
ncbi:MAG: Ig-like domain-containing protein [Planctomycetes bacterium]|nr:Ig-like domain-containing protein [Planctomycetota bacterium]